jgi:hypothetical protein
MIFSAFDFYMDQKLADGNKEQSFAPLPPEPNDQNRSMGAQKIIPPDSANSMHMCTITFVGGAFQNSPLQPDQEGPASEGLHLRIRGTLGQLSLLDKTAGPHTAASRSTSTAEDRTSVDGELHGRTRGSPAPVSCPSSARPVDATRRYASDVAAQNRPTQHISGPFRPDQSRDAGRSGSARRSARRPTPPVSHQVVVPPPPPHQSSDLHPCFHSNQAFTKVCGHITILQSLHVLYLHCKPVFGLSQTTNPTIMTQWSYTMTLS